MSTFFSVCGFREKADDSEGGMQAQSFSSVPQCACMASFACEFESDTPPESESQLVIL